MRSSGKLGRLLAVAVGAVVATHAAAQDAPEPWPERFWNPAPLPDDLVLPMPCGGGMAFRPVDVPSSHALDDRRVTLGWSDDNFNHSEAPRDAYVAGAFSAGDAVRRYYLGKYEVTELQWKSVMEDECPRVSGRGALPQAGIGRFDSIAFAHHYTAWLLRNAPETVPREAGVPGFVRLPSEEEWEFAARGGLAVDETVAQAKTYFEGAGAVNEYAWHDSTSSANGMLQRTGLLKPNALGLHDMLGNVEEIVADSFQLNHAGRLHGQLGGFMTKGGHFLTGGSQIRTSYRREHRPFEPDTGEPTRPRTVGLRVLLSAPVLVDQDRYVEVREQWRELSRMDVPDEAGLIVDIDDLDIAVEKIEDQALRRSIAGFAQRFRTGVALRNEQRDRAVSSYIRLGGFLGNKLKDDQRRLAGIETAHQGLVEMQSRGIDVGDRLVRYEEALAAGRSLLDETTVYYAETVASVAADYPADVVEDQIAAQIVELDATGQSALAPFVRQFGQHVAEFRKTKLMAPAQWRQAIFAVGE